MELNLPLIIIVSVVAMTLISFRIRRNQKDEKELEEQIIRIIKNVLTMKKKLRLRIGNRFSKDIIKEKRIIEMILDCDC